MKNNSDNIKQEGQLYKYFPKKESKAALKAETEAKITTYGSKSYVSKLIDSFRSDKTSGTKNYWLEVSE